MWPLAMGPPLGLLLWASLLTGSWGLGLHGVTAPDMQDPENAAPFQNIAEEARWGSSALSGPGSTYKASKKFANYLFAFIRNHSIHSMVEASAGHWPTGWQRLMEWPPVDYIGVDIVPKIIDENSELVEKEGTFGLKSVMFSVGDMISDELPRADLLVSKDTLIHFPNQKIREFMEKNILVCPPRFKHAIFMHDRYYKETSKNNADIPKLGRFHRIDLARPPFNYSAETVLGFAPPGMRQWKIVQHMEPGRHCP